MISSQHFFTGKWKDPAWLLKKTQAEYAKIPIEKLAGDQYSLAESRIVERRLWTPAISLIQPNLGPVIRELGIYYVPKTMAPGPCVVFPIHSYQQDHAVIAHQLCPFYPLVGRDGGLIKYGNLGEKLDEGKPRWFGDTDETLKAIHHYEAVLLVEGYFDLLAVRLLHPGLPVLSSGTKRLNASHVQYLRMLNVRQVHVMFDHESGKGGRESAGDTASRYTVKEWNGKHHMSWQAVATLSEDPSDALKDRRNAWLFRKQLETLFPVEKARSIE